MNTFPSRFIAIPVLLLALVALLAGCSLSQSKAHSPSPLKIAYAECKEAAREKMQVPADGRFNDAATEIEFTDAGYYIRGEASGGVGVEYIFRCDMTPEADRFRFNELSVLRQ